MTFIALGLTYVSYEIERDVRESGDCESLDHPEPCTEHLVALFGTGAVGVGAWGAAAGVGLLRGRSWGRWSVLIVFSVWVVLATVWWVALAGAPGGLDTGGIIIFAVMVGVFATVVVLAACLRMPRPTLEAANAPALRAKGGGSPTPEG
jgi:hypothetical protein